MSQLLREFAKEFTSTKARLLRDLRELQRSNVYGITLENNLYEWHVNLLGPKSSPHFGACLHLSIHFPTDYPKSPPKVKLLTKIMHFQAQNTWICSDLLETGGSDPTEIYSGWSSSYTVLGCVFVIFFNF